MSTTIGQAIGSSAGLKFATGGLAAALALGGGAVATGDLSCDTGADPAEVKSNLFVQTGLDGNADAQVESQRVEVEGLGFVDVAHSDSEIQAVEVQANEGASADIRSQNESSTEIDFILDGVTRTLLISVVDGELFASMAPSASADASGVGTVDSTDDATAGGGFIIDGDAGTGLNIDGGADAGSSVSEADSEAGLLGGLGIDIDFDG